jgi:hypothetical protein
MPGGFDPFPRRPGSRSARNVEALTKSMLRQRGTAYTDDPNSFVWLQSTCIARAIASAWETNQRLANQFDPYRTTDFLPRWEKIYGISPPPGATFSQRRTAVAARWILIGKAATRSGFEDVLRTLLPNTFVTVHYLSNHWAVNRTAENVFYPDTGTPFGTHPSHGTDPTSSNALGNWSSTIHHIAIELTQPSWMPNEDYYREARSIYSGILDVFLPTWTTFSAFKSNGETFEGFYLDAAGNLDNQAVGIVSSGLVVVNGGPVTQRIFPYLFVAGATGSTSSGKVYANFYGFEFSGGPTAITITLATGTAADTWGVLRQGTDPYAGGSAVPFHNNLILAALPDGAYTLEVSANATSTLGTSPGTVTITITSP